MNLAGLLRAEGVTVKEHAGWQQGRGRARYSSFEPMAVTVHHTACAGSCLNTVLKNNLYNVLISRDGTAHLITQKRAYHAGRGMRQQRERIEAGFVPYPDPPGVGNEYGNKWMYGVSCDYAPQRGQAMTAAQSDALVRVVAALLRKHSWQEHRIIAHHEYTTRKPGDPGVPLPAGRWKLIDMPQLRADVAQQLTPARRHHPDVEPWRALVTEYMGVADWPPVLGVVDDVLGMVAHESAGRPTARSGSNALGLLQELWRHWSNRTVGQPATATRPAREGAIGWYRRQGHQAPWMTESSKWVEWPAAFYKDDENYMGLPTVRVPDPFDPETAIAVALWHVRWSGWRHWSPHTSGTWTIPRWIEGRTFWEGPHPRGYIDLPEQETEDMLKHGDGFGTADGDPDVKLLQGLLGFTGGDVDGKYGSMTSDAVLFVKKEHGFGGDGASCPDRLFAVLDRLANPGSGTVPTTGTAEFTIEWD